MDFQERGAFLSFDRRALCKMKGLPEMDTDKLR
jgi:hypothetical protein